LGKRESLHSFALKKIRLVHVLEKKTRYA